MSTIQEAQFEQLQTTWHAKAKESSSYRFYSLYDKVYRKDVLRHAYRICQSNDGAPGVDGQTFEDIEAYGRIKWLRELTGELRTKSYRPEAVRRVEIPKPEIDTPGGHTSSDANCQFQARAAWASKSGPVVRKRQPPEPVYSA